ncbi:xylanase [Dyadobacter sp. CY107]|uniref:glycoside hydrolase n=1 Tax=Dyadobacter fanqingshengii TaxID=2906443 RepID=UPI001F1F7643|nr:glycoside hydrolase [Dyadobacter fanqingshengii]MCF2501887.1 xylanase [Dyadobacter fanqingshengii]
MNPTKQLLSTLLFALTLTSCSSATPGTVNGPGGKAEPITITINPAKTFQTIEHFGASDAWSCQFVGNWPDVKRNGIADLLFSSDTLGNGKPKGIGLSLWRFNIGAGTAEQGDASGIKDEWRRAESFLNNDGTYNWNKQAGQIWFLKAAKERGVSEFLAFPNSPPVQYTVNKKGYANGGKPNLTAEHFDKFGDFMANVVSGVREKTGITFNHISPVNEPQWDWSDGGQEGTPFFNNEIAGIAKSLSASLIKNKLPTKIDIAEAGQIDYLYSEFNKQGRGNQIHAFFDKTSPDYIGNLPNLTQTISGHSYFTTSPYSKAASKRQEIAKALQTTPGLKYWMSEYCILGDNEGEINGSGRDLGIGAGIYIAKVIHNDLVNASASAWHWWIAISPYNYKDGLIYIDKNKTDGSYQSSKMLWALGNYSRFVRPGAVRTEVSASSASEGLLISSYKNTDNLLVTVIINDQQTAADIALDLPGYKLSNMKIYKTSATSDLESSPVSAGSPVTVEAKSIVTIVGRLAQ